MSELVSLTIDDQQISVKRDMKVADAAKLAGIDISVFCYHPKLEPVGACRLCLVEIGRLQRDRGTGELILEPDGTPRVYFSGNLETACTVPVAEGMVIRSNNEQVLKAREDILEFILTSHPLDCPVCDKGGECSLQELTFSYGLGDSRFPLAEKIKLGKHIPLGDLIYLDQERCIQCGRCIRFQSEIAGDPVLAFYNRGRKTDIVTYSDPPFDSYWSGNTTDLCPVGALTTRDFRFESRIWEMETSPSICSHCPVGCNITINTRQDPKTGRNTIQRIMPRQNEWVNELWICDKGRFAHHYTDHKKRLTKPLARDSKGKLKSISWSKALKIAEDQFKSNPDGLVTLVGGRLANEDYYQLAQLTEDLSGKAVLDSNMAGGNLAAQIGLGEGTNLKDLGPGDALLVVACDLEEEAPLWWLRVKAASERGATLILVNPRETRLDQYADHILRYDYGGETQAILDLIGKKSDASRSFKEAENGLVFYGSEGIGLAASKLLSQACVNLLIKSKHIGKKNSGLIPVWPGPNIQGAWDMGFEPVDNIRTTLSKAKNLIIAGADPIGDGSIENLNGKFTLVQELFLTETAAQADLVIPVLASPEKSGTFTSGERRVQRFEKALPTPGENLADYEFAAKLGHSLGLEYPSTSEEILNEIIQNKPGYEISLAALRQVPDQWPPVAKEALSFTGTVFKNTAGIGVQLNSSDTKMKSRKVTVTKPKSRRGLYGVPITKLYDQGIMTRTSEVLAPRSLKNQVYIHPENAEKLGLSNLDQLTLSISGNEYEISCLLDRKVPVGFLLIPRSTGIPLEKPATVKIKAGE